MAALGFNSSKASQRKNLLIHYSHFQLCIISEKSNIKPHGTHIIKSAQDIGADRSCGLSKLLLLPLVINVICQCAANGFRSVSRSIADSIVTH